MAGPKREPKIEDLVHDLGLTAYNRRLADKILNAFNQATAVGRSDVAAKLEEALRVCIDEEQEMRNAAFLAKAESWRRFVELRDGYQELVARRGQGSREAQAALTQLRQVYEEWSRL